ncbi:MAG: hypothetical protein CMC70_09110 [Flavobacteriaceae bacterium]|nr:hypothetical protein [Flavobacteriaceae bacterium]
MTKASANKIDLQETHFFGEGAYQRCYVHPTQPDLCIKVLKENVAADRVENELVYYKKLNRRALKNVSYPFFAAYKATVKTNFGDGFVYDLIRDETTGNISKTLDRYLLEENPAISLQVLELAFKKFKKAMIQNRVVANDVRSYNICCRLKNDGNVELVLIDGLGHRDFFPFVDFSEYFAKKKLFRRLERFRMLTMEDHKKFLMQLKDDEAKGIEIADWILPK